MLLFSDPFLLTDQGGIVGAEMKEQQGQSPPFPPYNSSACHFLAPTACRHLQGALF